MPAVLRHAVNPSMEAQRHCPAVDGLQTGSITASVNQRFSKLVSLYVDVILGLFKSFTATAWPTLSKPTRKISESGFTLIELVIVIVIVGILSIGATRFITATVGGYVDTAQRQQLAAAGLVAAEKISRELRNALPNSLRPRAGESFPDVCLEYIPIAGGTDYITIPVDAAGNQLEVLAPGITLTNSMRFAVYPRMVSDLYSRPNPGPVSPLFASSATAAGDSVVLTIAGNHRFATDSPTRRLYAVHAPRAYCFDGARLYHYTGYASYAADGRPDAATRLVVLDHLQTGSGQSVFDYLPASLVRNAVVNFQFSQSKGGDSWLTEQEVQIRNVP